MLMKWQVDEVTSLPGNKINYSCKKLYIIGSGRLKVCHWHQSQSTLYWRKLKADIFAGLIDLSLVEIAS